MGYEKDMYIDERSLDVECLEQASLMVKYSQKLAEARMERDLAKEALDLLRAEIDLNIRDDPEAFNLTKVTEAAITNRILQEEDYQDAQRTYNNANYEVNLLQGVVSAIEQRKSMLEKLVQLHGQQYFAGPAIPHNISEVRQQRKAEAEESIGKAFIRRKPKS